MKKCLVFPGFILLLLIWTHSPVSAVEITDNECIRDADCVNYLQELGRKNFEILREIRDHYVERIGFEDLISAFRNDGLKGVFAKLDPHSKYITADEHRAREKKDAIRGGIGIKYKKTGSKFMVESLTEGWPAAKSGKIIVGDQIIAVDGKTTEGVDRDTFNYWMLGEAGTSVFLRIRREGPEPAEFTLELKREILRRETIFSKVFGDVGYIGLSDFEDEKSIRFREILGAFPENITGLIIDLRDNLGGSFSETTKIASMFLERNQQVVRHVKRNRTDIYLAGSSRSPDSRKISLPMVVLVDDLSASGSEMLAAALQDNKRAIIVGVPTFGKAVSQNCRGYYSNDEYWLKLLDGDYFCITEGRLYRPNGRTLQAKGIVPDVIVFEGGGDDVEKFMQEREVSEDKLKGYLRGEEVFSAEETGMFDILKQDRQLYVALALLKILEGGIGR